MSHVFISYSSQDDVFVTELREAPKGHKIESWDDAQNFRGGDVLLPVLQQAIETAGAFLLVVSLDTFNSTWVQGKLTLALECKKTNKKYMIIQLLIRDAKLSALKWMFPDERLGISIDESPTGLEEAMPQLLAALGKRLPDDPQPIESMPQEPFEKLALELSDPSFKSEEGKRRALAKAKLTFHSAKARAPPVEAPKRF